MTELAPCLDKGILGHQQSSRKAIGLLLNPVPGATWPGTIVDAEEASRAECGTPEQCRSDQRDYADLQAQRQAAEAAQGQESAAWLQTWIAVVATFVAGLGTAYLISTFKETKRTADAAIASVAVAKQTADAAIEANRLNRDAYDADIRPWVTISYEPVGGVERISYSYKFEFLFVLQNIGKSPAVEVGITLKAFPTSQGIDIAHEQGNLWEVTQSKNIRMGNTLLLGQILKKKRQVLIDSDDANKVDLFIPLIVGFIVYSFPGSDETHRTGFIFHVHRALQNGELRTIPLSPELISAESIRLVRYGYDGRID